MTQRTRARKPTSPGDILRYEFLEPADITQTQLASHIGCDKKTINRIINGHTRVTPKIARLLAAALGTTDRFWLHLQNAVDLYEAEQEIPELPPRIAPFNGSAAAG